MKILYPGTFDPLTNGHLDLIERSQRIFGQVVVAILENTNKTTTFTLKKRIEQITSSISHLSNVKVISYNGLTVDCAKEVNADLILRGLRAMSDFEYELQISHTNRTLNKDIETIFLSTDTNFSFLSSSLVKEVAKFNGEINHMVPPIVEEDLKYFFNKS